MPVVVSPEAEAQSKAIDSWWRENRVAAPDLFVQELARRTGLWTSFRRQGTARDTLT